MTVLDVSIKHSGKVYKTKLDTDAPPIVFKQSISDLTSVPVDRMKVMIKGGVLKVCTRVLLISISYYGR